MQVHVFKKIPGTCLVLCVFTVLPIDALMPTGAIELVNTLSYRYS